MSANFDFFYGRELEQFSFIRIPKLLFTDKEFSKLSNDAKLLYSLMLDRMSLSKQNSWLDEGNKVFIIFTVEEAAEMLNCGTEKVTKLFSELDDKKGIGLITRQRRGLGKPSVIYLHKFTGEENGNDTSEGTDPTDRISENQENGKTKISTPEYPLSVNRNSEIHECGKSKCNNTDFNKTDMNKTDFDHHLPAHGNEDQDREDDEEIISSVNEKIGYASLCNEYDSNIVTELRNIIADVIKGIRPVKVSGTFIDGKRASQVFSGLCHSNAVSVLDSMKQTEVHAPSSWIPAALYNSMLNNSQNYSDNEQPRHRQQLGCPSFDIDLIMEHAKNNPLKLRCCT